jgi:hypothetical protein
MAKLFTSNEENNFAVGVGINLILIIKRHALDKD